MCITRGELQPLLLSITRPRRNKCRYNAGHISHSLPSRTRTQALRLDWCMVINYYKATRHYQLPPQKPSQTQICHSFPAASMSKKRKWKIVRYRKKSRAKRTQMRPGIFCKSLGNQQSTPSSSSRRPCCPRSALRFSVSASRFNRFSGSMQYICRIVSAADVHVTFSACRSWTCCPACPRPRSRAA